MISSFYFRLNISLLPDGSLLCMAYMYLCGFLKNLFEYIPDFTKVNSSLLADVENLLVEEDRDFSLSLRSYLFTP